MAQEPPDLILLDIMMPGIDGHEVCRRLRADVATALLPIVMVTASGDQNKVKALESGADDFIPKPVNQVELLARVRSPLRIKVYRDTIQQQAAELAEWNRTLEERVQDQVVRLAVAMRRQMMDVSAAWHRRGYELGFGIGLVAGYATLGCLGFAGQFHCGAIGSTVNLASRLCDEAHDGQVLLNARARAAVGELASCEPLPDLTVKGFSRPVRAFEVLRLT